MDEINNLAPKKNRKKWIVIVSIIIILIIAVLFSTNDSSKDESNKSVNNTEAVSLDDVGGFEQWQQGGFKENVTTKIAITVPDNTANTYCTAMIGNMTDLTIDDLNNDNYDNINYVQITSPDESSIQDWNWLMEAIENSESAYDIFYFEATLSYKDMYEDVMPMFEITNVKAATENTASNTAIETEITDDSQTENSESTDNTGFIKVEHIDGTGPSFAEIEDIENCIDYQSLGYETAEDFWFAVMYPSLYENDDSIPAESLAYVEANVDYKARNFETAEDYWNFTVYEAGDYDVDDIDYTSSSDYVNLTADDYASFIRDTSNMDKIINNIPGKIINFSYVDASGNESANALVDIGGVYTVVSYTGSDNTLFLGGDNVIIYNATYIGVNAEGQPILETSAIQLNN